MAKKEKVRKQGQIDTNIISSAAASKLFVLDHLIAFQNHPSLFWVPVDSQLVDANIGCDMQIERVTPHLMCTSHKTAPKSCTRRCTELAERRQ